jgi:hypothetical protein
MDLDGVHTTTVIDIVNNTKHYPSSLGLDWAFDNQVIINLNTKKMVFESGEYRVIETLDPSEGGRYVEPAIQNFITEEINQFYRTTARDED